MPTTFVMPRPAGFALAAMLVATSALPVLAQAQPSRVRGAIDHLAGTELVVKAGSGTVDIALPEGARVASVARASLGDIKPGSFIGTAAMPSEGGLRALEVLVFPEAMRGTGEGHREWDLMPESTMTNATVASTVGQVNGETLDLTYKGGQQKVTVPPGTPIVTLAPATRADLKPGARVVINVTKDKDGRMTAASVIVGKDGVDPPM